MSAVETSPETSSASFQLSRQGLWFGVGLLVIWTLYVALLFPLIRELGGLTALILRELCRVAIFVVPVFWLVRRWEPSWWEALGIAPVRLRGLWWGFRIAVTWFAVLLLLEVTIQHRTIRLPVGVWGWLQVFSLALVSEELVFRGYLLQALRPRGHVFAVAVSALAFVVIHYPGWWFLGTVKSPQTWLIFSVSIFALGCLLGWLFLLTRSFWACVMVHAAHNLAATLVV